MKQPIGNLQLACPSLLAIAAGRACFLLLFLMGFAKASASELPVPVTLDLPIPANLATPAWLGHPDTPATAFAALNMPILTPDTNASLLVTVYFQEKQGGFMRIAWKGTQGAELLSDNFYEDIGMANQRSLLISPATLIGDGILALQCGDSKLGIQRIKLEWLESKTSLVSPEVQNLLVTPATGQTLSATSLNGAANPVEAAAWQGQIVNVPLADQALRVEQGVDFSVDLDKVPGSARLSLKETGLPLGKRLVVWLNEKRAGTITPTVPDLLDDGFLTDGTALTSYVGWRDGSFYVPVALLKAGVNTVQFSEEDDAALTLGTAAPQETPLAMKGITMQLNYQPLVKTAIPSPQLSSTPTGPLSPADTSSTSSDIPAP